MRWSSIEGAGGKVHPSRPGGDIARGRPVGGPGDRAGLPGCAGAARWRPAVGPVARSRGSAPRSRPAPASRTHRGGTPSRTPPRGSAACATARLWRSRLPAAPSAEGEGATWRDVGDRPTGVGGRRRASRGAGITRTRIPPPARSPVIDILGTRSCRGDNLGARGRRARRRASRPLQGLVVFGEMWGDRGDDRAGGPRRGPASSRPDTRHTGRMPADVRGGAMVVDRGGRGEGASVTPRRRHRAVGPASYQPSAARPSTPVSTSPRRDRSRRWASTPSSTCRAPSCATVRP